MRALCIKGLELALILRETAATFEWGQGEALGKMPLTDTDVIPNFSMKSRSGLSKPVRILFGPLWKVVDGERILERKGDMLSGGGPEYYVRSSSQR